MVKTIEIAWIPLSDGRRLAARLFLPADAGAKPVPVILEYIPYRRRDGTRLGDDEIHLWFAANGYACARVDIAGTGDSDGLVGDEYVKREQDDACEVIDWLGRQPWCSGAVGMIGISWGGFSGLQAAARRPARLKAVISLCSTDDRYACDAHYFGGCLLNDNFNWGGAFFNYAALPPDPAIVGHDKWREMWRQRIDNLSLLPADWLRHQRRDAFWRHGSIYEDYSAIECPVLAVGGWLDGYTRTVFRLVENLTAPCKGIIGPWGHKEPHIGFPGPAIGFLQECKRWWDHWLKGKANGVDQDPDMRLWLLDPQAPDHSAAERQGRWLAFPTWRKAPITAQKFNLTSDGSLGGRRKGRKSASLMSIKSPLTTGQAAQEWCPYGLGRIAPDGATDQRVDDANSLCFDHAPLASALKIVGTSWARLRLKSDKPLAQVAVRLVDVAPDGAATLVTFGVLNLAHRKSDAAPELLRPGRFYDVDVELKPVAQIIAKDHVLRLAVSSAYWPMIWPSPELVTLTLEPASCSLSLPILASGFRSRTVSFAKAVKAQHGPVIVLEPGGQQRHRSVDVATQHMELTVRSDDGRYRIEETDTEVSSSYARRITIARDDPGSASSESDYRSGFSRADWQARLHTKITVTSTVKSFHIKGTLSAYDQDKPFAERVFDEVIPRDHL